MMWLTRLGLAFVTLLLTASSVQADSIPPPQPPTCAWCDGPPPPPLPLPTVAPVAVVPVSVISVKLSPTHVMRGKGTNLKVEASFGDNVSAVVQYHGLKPAVYNVLVGPSGGLEKTLKVPKDVPLGKAQLKVTVADSSGPYSTTITFDVVR